VLASQFNSSLHPVTVLTILPLALSGAALGLLVTGKTLNVFSMIGILLLMGIVKKNSILLVDFTNQLREQGYERHQALLKAGPTRLRAILMTSIATIAGALPPALAFGPGSELQRPMAVSVVGGMLLSTLFTLFVVPSAYSVLDDVVTWNEERRKDGVPLWSSLGGLMRRGRARHDAPTPIV
jgi:multidrug efflux pump subunit AcrB